MGGLGQASLGGGGDYPVGPATVDTGLQFLEAREVTGRWLQGCGEAFRSKFRGSSVRISMSQIWHRSEEVKPAGTTRVSFPWQCPKMAWLWGWVGAGKRPHGAQCPRNSTQPLRDGSPCERESDVKFFVSIPV